MDVAALRTAHEDFLAVATAGGFGPPVHGEWDAERLPVLIVSAGELVTDEPWSLEDLVAGVARIHLPAHAGQLARLRP